MIPLANASTLETIFVPDDGEIETLTIHLQANQKLNGAFNVTGRIPRVIDFWVRDPNGAVILESGTVAEGENFTFTANNSGGYVLNFQNFDDYSKTISLEYNIESEFLPMPNQDNLLLWIIIIALLIGLGLMGSVIAFLLRRKNK